MEWYWWVLIGLGVAFLGYLKLKIFNNMTKKSKNKNHHDDED